jgi:cell division protein FtsL
MRGATTTGAVVLAVAAAVTLYAVAYDTRRLEIRVHAMEKSVERTEAEIVAMRAELAHLSRPERIEPLAQAMGLRPPARLQFVPESRLPRRDGQRP